MGQESLRPVLTNQRKVNETIKPKNYDNVIVANTRKPVDNKIALNKKTRSQNQRIQTRKTSLNRTSSSKKTNNY
jgi:hypothetical protein